MSGVRRAALALLASTALATETNAQAATFSSVPGKGFSERLQNNLAISTSGSVVGLTVHEAAPKAPKRVLWIRFLAPFSGRVEVRAVSVDGSYEASGQFEGEAPAATWVRLPIAVGNRAAAKRRETAARESLATVARVIDERGLPRDHVLTGWTAGEAPPSDGPLMVALQGPPGTALELPGGAQTGCSVIQKMPRKFNMLCQAPSTAFQTANLIRIRQRDAGAEKLVVVRLK